MMSDEQWDLQWLLLEAMRKGAAAVREAIAAGADPNMPIPLKQGYGKGEGKLYGALHALCSLDLTRGENDLEMAHALFDAGADVNAYDGTGMQPLHHIADSLYVSSRPVARLFIERGADLAAVSRHRDAETPLMVAAGVSAVGVDSNLGMVELLLAAGASAAFRNEFGLGPHLSAFMGHGSESKTFQLLAQAGECESAELPACYTVKIYTPKFADEKRWESACERLNILLAAAALPQVRWTWRGEGFCGLTAAEHMAALSLFAAASDELTGLLPKMPKRSERRPLSVALSPRWDRSAQETRTRTGGGESARAHAAIMPSGKAS